MNWGAVAKNKTASAISSPRPLRRMGVCLAMRRIKAAADFSPRSIIPGATAFTAISGANPLAGTFATTAPHPFQRFTADEEWASRVRGKNRIPLLDGQLFKLGSFVVCRVVDKDIYPSQFPSRVFHHGSDTTLVSYVAAQREGPDSMP